MKHAGAAARKAQANLPGSSCEGTGTGSARPEATKCKVCGRPVEPFLNKFTRGWIERDMCDECEKQRHEREADIEARQRRAYRQRERLASSGLPPRAEGWSFETAEAAIRQVLDGTDRQAWLKAHLQCRTWVNTGKKPLYIIGGTGTGKTVLAYCIVHRAIVKDDLSAYLLSISDFFDQITAGAGRDSDAMRSVRRAKAAQVLVMDDLGARRATKAKADLLFSVVDHRYAHKLPTVITTNLQPGELNEAMGDGCGRIVSRLLDNAEAVKIELEAGDMRLLGLMK